MELRGTFEQISRNIKTGKFLITLAVESIPEGVDSLPDGELAITIKKHREKRSLSANAYYWQLVGKIAAVIHQPTPYVHNFLLRRYGPLEVVDGSTLMIFIPDTQEAEEKVALSETYHLKPTGMSKIVDDGRVFRAYLVLKGSSQFDKKEMSILIDGAVDDAKALGIEVLPPEEIERMMEAYEKHYAARS